MKRHVSIILTVIILSLLLLGTGCTCKLDEGLTCRGWGYEAMKGCILAGDCVAVDDTGEKLVSKNKVAIEGVDYGTPVITFSQDGTNVDFSMTIDVMADLSIEYTVYIVQDGVVLTEVSSARSLPGYEGTPFTVTINKNCAFKGKYNPNGGAFYYIIDRLEIYKDE